MSIWLSKVGFELGYLITTGEVLSSTMDAILIVPRRDGGPLSSSSPFVGRDTNQVFRG